MPEYDSTIEYRDVVGFPGYKVGNDGSVWSCMGRGGLSGTMTSSWRLLKPGRDRGYLNVTLMPGRKMRFVHRLVLEAFIGPRPPGLQCRHFPDRSRDNNSLSNLRWGTPEENQADRVTHGTDSRGTAHPSVKITEAAMLAIRCEYAAGGVACKRLAQKYGLSASQVKRIIRRQSWGHIQ